MPGDIVSNENDRSVNWKRLFFLSLGLLLFITVYYSSPWSAAVDPMGGKFILSREGKGALAVALLAAKTLPVSGMVAAVITADCSRCGVCISLCPYSAPNWDEKSGKAVIESSLCKGCGLCVASCRSGAINLKGFDMPQIMAMIEEAR